jgi:hypothetical protein
LNEISSVSTLKYSLYKQGKGGTLPIETGCKLKPGETLQIVGVDEERLKTLVPSLTEDEIQALKAGKACLVKNPIAISYEGNQMETTSFHAGDIVSVAHTELKVLGNCAAVGLDNQGFVNGVQVVVFDPVYDQLIRKEQLFRTVSGFRRWSGYTSSGTKHRANLQPNSRQSLAFLSKTDKQLEEASANQAACLGADTLYRLIGF